MSSYIGSPDSVFVKTTLHFGVCSVFGKQLYDISTGSFTRSVESSAVLASMCVDVRSFFFEKKLCDLQMASLGGSVEGVTIAAALGVEIYSFFEKKTYDLPMAP